MHRLGAFGIEDYLGNVPLTVGSAPGRRGQEQIDALGPHDDWAGGGRELRTVGKTDADAVVEVRGCCRECSRREALALDWEGDPTAALAHLCPYGPLRETDAGL